jgi:hypothetical protein
MMVRRKPWAALVGAMATLALAVPAATAGAATTAPSVNSAQSDPNGSPCEALRIPTEQAVLYGSPAVTDSLVQAWTGSGCGPVPPI